MYSRGNERLTCRFYFSKQLDRHLTSSPLKESLSAPLTFHGAGNKNNPPLTRHFRVSRLVQTCSRSLVTVPLLSFRRPLGVEIGLGRAGEASLAKREERRDEGGCERTTSKRIGLIRWPNAIKTFLLATVNLSLLPRPRSKLSLPFVFRPPALLPPSRLERARATPFPLALVANCWLFGGSIEPNESRSLRPLCLFLFDQPN